MKRFLLIGAVVSGLTVAIAWSQWQVGEDLDVFGTPVGPSVDTTFAERLQAVLDEELISQDLMGISAAVITPSLGTWLGVSGMSNPAAGDSIAPDMLFCAGSITKTYVAALVLNLAEEGRLSLDDSLHQWLPSYPNIDSTITIRQLLNHTSGIYNIVNNPAWLDSIFTNPTRYWTPEEVLLTFVKEPSFPPGSDWEYSNTNYIVLGMIIIEATQSKVSTELKSRFLDPLNLNSTFLFPEDVLQGDLAEGWSDLDHDGTLEGPVSAPDTAGYSSTWTASGVFATAEDVAKWAAALYGGEVLSQSYLQQMLTISPPSTAYGLGVARRHYFGRDLWGHAGDVVGYRTYMFYSPKDHISITVFVNQLSSFSMSSIFTRLLYVALINEYQLPVPDLDPYAIQLGNIAANASPVDTTFWIYNRGVAPDTIYASLDYDNADTNAVLVDPMTFVLAPGDSQGITFTIMPSLLESKRYVIKITFDSRYDPDLGYVNLKKTIVFTIESPTAIADHMTAFPKSCAFEQNYPNPFNRSTTIIY
ncbi:MAG: serine hydrolase domain-containing protein [bacterium]